MSDLLSEPLICQNCFGTYTVLARDDKGSLLRCTKCGKRAVTVRDISDPPTCDADVLARTQKMVGGIAAAIDRLG